MADIKAMSGFGPGAIIMTPDGELPVEWLATGDRVITRDHGTQPIIHIERSQEPLHGGHPLPVPLRLKPGLVAGQGGLAEPLRLSPHSCVLVRGAQVDLHFGFAEGMAQIGDLSRRKFSRDDTECAALTYHHIFTADHALIWCCGIWVETTGLETAALLDLPPRIADMARSFWTPRPVLTRTDAHLLRDLLLPEQSLRRLIAA